MRRGTRREHGLVLLVAGGVVVTGLLAACVGADTATEDPVPAPSQTPTRSASAPDPAITASPSAKAARVMDDVQQTLRSLVESPRLANWDGTAAAAVRWKGAEAGIGMDRSIQSASAAKAYWVDAAAENAGLDVVEPYVRDIFTYSANDASGEVIGLIGIDAVNDYTRSLGMAQTYLASWHAGGDHDASDQATHGTYNVTSAGNAVAFMDHLLQTADEGDEVSEQVLDWMRLAPDRYSQDTTYGAALTHHLPADVAAGTAHKSGWLLPGAATSVQNTLLAIGAVPLPDGSHYTVAIQAQDGSDYVAQARGIAEASKVIYDTIMHSAGFSGDEPETDAWTSPSRATTPSDDPTER